jgi:AbrB family looped-hinge helix DNA binding protein
MTTITLTSKGQITLPIEARRLLGLKESDKLAVVVDPKSRSITLSKPLTVDELAKMSHALPRKQISPVIDVDAYYQTHRGESI